MSFIYKEIWPAVEKVAWKECVLNNLSTPRAQFITWLALRVRLATKVRLLKFAILVDTTCVLCDNSVETVHHLYFDCAYTVPALQGILDWLGLHTGSISSLNLMATMVKGRSSRYRFLKAIMSELVYAIWHERNQRIF